MFSLSFALAMRDGVRVAYVGGIQGVRGDDTRESYKSMTKSLHGMRPRDFLFEVFRLLCLALQVAEILAISDEARHHRSKYFGEQKSAQFFGNYDEVWLERGGVRRNLRFFQLSPWAEHKSLDEIASKKRAMYRRRFEFMDALGEQLARRFFRQFPQVTSQSGS